MSPLRPTDVLLTYTGARARRFTFDNVSLILLGYSL
jgi:hypothetical protein